MSEPEGEGERPAAGSSARRVEKPWGHELIWAETERYAGKILTIEAGKRLSLQYHERKDESIYVLSGRLLLHLEGADGEIRTEELELGEFRRIPVGRRHRFEGLELTHLVEVSSPELDDVVRVADDFGREGTSEP